MAIGLPRYLMTQRICPVNPRIWAFFVDWRVSIFPFGSIFSCRHVLLEQVNSGTSFTAFLFVCLKLVSVFLVYASLGFSDKLLTSGITQALRICLQTKFVFLTFCLATFSCHARGLVLGIQVANSFTALMAQVTARVTPSLREPCPTPIHFE